MSAVGDMICGITGLSIYEYHPYSIAGSCPDWCPKRREKMTIKELYDTSKKLRLQDCEIRISEGDTFESSYDLQGVEWHPEMEFVILKW